MLFLFRVLPSNTHIKASWQGGCTVLFFGRASLRVFGLFFPLRQTVSQSRSIMMDVDGDNNVAARDSNPVVTTTTTAAAQTSAIVTSAEASVTTPMSLVECTENVAMLHRWATEMGMGERLSYYLHKWLPATLRAEKEEKEAKQERFVRMTEEMTCFVQIFLSRNKYFFLKSSGLFFLYGTDGHFRGVSENDIIHQLRTTITQAHGMTDWKYKCRVHVLKQIRERSLFSCVPESETIQDVLRALVPTFFRTKSDAKYFLTFLGDHVVKKAAATGTAATATTTSTIKTHLLFPQSAHTFLNELNRAGHFALGVRNATADMSVVCHDRIPVAGRRWVAFNELFSMKVWRETLARIGIDLFCVAAHYKARYGSAEQYLAWVCEKDGLDDGLSEVAPLLGEGAAERAMDQAFLTEMHVVHDADPECTITVRQMVFLWHMFLARHGWGDMRGRRACIQRIAQHLPLQEDTGVFHHARCDTLQDFIVFQTFWQKDIECSDRQSMWELELEEIGLLFDQWKRQQAHQAAARQGLLSPPPSPQDGSSRPPHATTIDIFRWIQYGLKLGVYEGKYVFHVRSRRWHKEEEVLQVLQTVLSRLDADEGGGGGGLRTLGLPMVSLDDLYRLYKRHVQTSLVFHTTMVVNKQYFEKVVRALFHGRWIHDVFLSVEWLEAQGSVWISEYAQRLS